jgi:hypothetical protein
MNLRRTFVLSFCTLALGCGGKPRPATNDVDMSAKPIFDMTINFGDDDGGGDMAGPSVDMAFPEDMAMACVPNGAVGNGNTGAVCRVDKDCKAGPNMQAGKCVFKLNVNGNMIDFPGGYCTSACDPGGNTVGGQNIQCPGGNGTCLDLGGDNMCVTLCSNTANCRNCYACFIANDSGYGCLPGSLSQCNPSVPNSCPFANGKPQTCADQGQGDVGTCALTCDPFLNKGCPNGKECHISAINGLGYCTKTGNVNNFMPGDPCIVFANDCPGGYGCNMGSCWKYCNDANRPMQCGMAYKCQPFPGMLDTMTVGICEMSM